MARITSNWDLLFSNHFYLNIWQLTLASIFPVMFLWRVDLMTYAYMSNETAVYMYNKKIETKSAYYLQRRTRWEYLLFSGEFHKVRL